MSAGRGSERRNSGPVAPMIGTFCLAIVVAACSGSNGAAGTAGATGPAGPPGPQGPPVTALDVRTAKTITATITAVEVPAAAPISPVVKFKLVNELGQPLKGVQASELGFAIAKLVPAGTSLKPVPPAAAATTSLVSSQWQSYIYKTASPAPGIVGQTPQPQATVEAGAMGTLLDNGDGTFQYSFKQDLSADPNVSFDGTLVHRVALEIRGTPALVNSPVYTFQPSTGATTNLPLSREIVDDQTCKNCHMKLGLPNEVGYHGGVRTEVQYCVMCHNPSSVDPSTGNTLDFKVMFHKIHMGASLPSVLGNPAATPPVPGVAYQIYGYMNSVNDYSRIVFPTHDLRTCYACHNEADTATPDTVAWRTTPSIEACGSCHDNVNFQTGTNHTAANLGGLTNADCLTCHGPSATIGNGAFKVDVAHVIPERAYQKKFAYQIVSVTGTAPGQTPVIRFSVTDPTNNNKPWNILTDEPFTECAGNAPSDLLVMVAWNTTDHTNLGIGANGGEIDIPAACAAPLPIDNGDGTFTVTSPQPIPVNVTGSACALVQGHPTHDFNDGRGPQAIPVPNVIAVVSITDPTPVPRRTVVSLKKCDACHDQLNPLAHGGDRVETLDGCTFCHTPNSTDQATRAQLGIVTAADATANAPDQLQEQAIDFKILIHAVHFGPNRGLVQNAPYIVYHNAAINDFTNITPFPGTVSNCLGCHAAGTFYPVAPGSPVPLASTIQTVDATGAPLANQIAITAGSAVCSACHATLIDKAHMMQNGGNFAAVKDPNSLVVSTEQCAVCHGSGAVADVAVVHALGSFQ